MRLQNRQYLPYEPLSSDLKSPETTGSPYDKRIDSENVADLLRRIAINSEIDIKLKTINYSNTPVAFSITATPTQIIQPSQFPRGYLIFNADFAINTTLVPIFIGGQDVSVANGYPIASNAEKVIYLKQNAFLFAVSGGTVPIRILQLQ